MRPNNFDLLRLFAATQVMYIHTLHHLSVDLPWFAPLNYFHGVSIFFVISGFLISATFERSTTLYDYIKNRVLRIFPALWCCIILTVLLFSLCGVNFFNSQTAPWLLSQLIGVIYTPSFLENFGFGSYNGSLWTIPVQLQFYTVLPVLYWLIHKRNNKDVFFVLIWLLFLVVAVILPAIGLIKSGNEIETMAQKLVRYSFVSHFYMFMIGLLLQHYSLYKNKYILNKGLYWVISYLLICILFPSSLFFQILSKLILAVATVSVAYSLPNISNILLRKNDISYGVYIYHGLILNLFVNAGLQFYTEYFFLSFAFSYLAGYLSWLLVERPVLNLKKTRR